MKKLSLLLAGVGGYGGLIAREVLEHCAEHNAEVVGIVEPFLENSPVKEQIRALSLPVYAALEDFYKEHQADLAILSTPIHLHAQQSIFVLEHGSDCLCEKPTAPTLQEAAAMQQAAERTGKHLTIGYQLSHSPAVLDLKKDILAGRLGKPVILYAMTCWPRNSAYFARPWAAKIKVDGHYVLDSIAMNACAHYLHNMFFLLGKSIDQSARPALLEASVARANAIETYDTACFRVFTQEGSVLNFTATHASRANINPQMRFLFENARVEMAETDDENGITAYFKDGEIKHYGPTTRDRFQKIWYCCEVARGRKQPLCTVETAWSHLQCVNAVSEFAPVHRLTAEKENDVMVVSGIDTLFQKAFRETKMPWELSDLIAPPVKIPLENYHSFGGIK